MATDQLTLFVGSDFVSVFAMSAFVALREKGLQFEVRKVDLKAKEQLKPDYADLSLTCRVPTLVHRGFSFSESSAIAEYLDDTFAAPPYKPVLPRDIQQRARARQIQAWLRSDMQPLRSERPADLFFFPGEAKPLSEAAQAAANKLVRVSQALIRDGQSSLFGEWCIADTDLGVMLNRLVYNKDPVPATLRKFVERQIERDSLKAWWGQDRN